MKSICVFALLAISNLASAAPISSVTCDSYMEEGFDIGQEKGSFTYTANPLKISVTLPKREVLLTDSKHICQMTRDSVQYSISAEGDASTGLEITLTSQPNGDRGDGGQISLAGNQSGLFRCSYFIFVYGEEIKLSNCVVK